MAKGTEPAGILVVVESFAYGLTVYRKGELIDADHPAVKEWPSHFGPVIVQHRSPKAEARVEQATAAPGEKRGA